MKLMVEIKKEKLHNIVLKPRLILSVWPVKLNWTHHQSGQVISYWTVYEWNWLGQWNWLVLLLNVHVLLKNSEKIQLEIKLVTKYWKRHKSIIRHCQSLINYFLKKFILHEVLTRYLLVWSNMISSKKIWIKIS